MPATVLADSEQLVCELELSGMMSKSILLLMLFEVVPSFNK